MFITEMGLHGPSPCLLSLVSDIESIRESYGFVGEAHKGGMLPWIFHYDFPEDTLLGFLWEQTAKHFYQTPIVCCMPETMCRRGMEEEPQ